MSLHGLLRHRVPLHSDVRSEVRSAYRMLDGVSRTRIERSAFSQVRLGGNRRLYRFLLSVCRLIYENSLVCENSGQVIFRDFRQDEATMWAVFEDFVTGFYKREQQVYQVNPKGRGVEWHRACAKEEDDLARIPIMTADLILDSPARRIILDTKYYRDALTRRTATGTGKLHSSNLYQLLAYLRNRQATERSGAKHEGILLYPEVGERLRIDIRLEGFRIQARTVNLNQDWRRIHEEMLSTIDLAHSNRAA